MTARDSDPGIAVVAIASIQAVVRTNGLEVDTCKTLNFKTHISSFNQPVLNSSAKTKRFKIAHMHFTFFDKKKKPRFPVFPISTGLRLSDGRTRSSRLAIKPSNR
jgi:hypothetical protein